jgi:hypothetical protein
MPSSKRRRRAEWPAVWLATACGPDFGVTAFLLKVVPDMLPQGFGDPLRQWPFYLVVVGPLGFLLNQSAFQAGRLIAPVLAIITALDPLSRSASHGCGWTSRGERPGARSLRRPGRTRIRRAVFTIGSPPALLRPDYQISQHDTYEPDRGLRMPGRGSSGPMNYYIVVRYTS